MRNPLCKHKQVSPHEESFPLRSLWLIRTTQIRATSKRGKWRICNREKLSKRSRKLHQWKRRSSNVQSQPEIKAIHEPDEDLDVYLENHGCWKFNRQWIRSVKANQRSCLEELHWCWQDSWFSQSAHREQKLPSDFSNLRLYLGAAWPWTARAYPGREIWSHWHLCRGVQKDDGASCRTRACTSCRLAQRGGWGEACRSRIADSTHHILELSSMHLQECAKRLSVWDVLFTKRRPCRLS